MAHRVVWSSALDWRSVDPVTSPIVVATTYYPLVLAASATSGARLQAISFNPRVAGGGFATNDYPDPAASSLFRIVRGSAITGGNSTTPGMVSGRGTTASSSVQTWVSTFTITAVLKEFWLPPGVPLNMFFFPLRDIAVAPGTFLGLEWTPNQATFSPDGGHMWWSE